MNRVWIALLAAAGFAATAASGQTTQTRIFTDPPGATFYVDGTKYTSSATFFWPQGSRHTIWTDVAQSTGGTTRMAFQGWSDEKGLLQTGGEYITITADPGFPSLKGSFGVEHRIDFHLSGQGIGPLPDLTQNLIVPCPASGSAVSNGVPGNFTGTVPGVLFINGQCVASSVSIWAGKGATLTLNAFPARGFVFEGWTMNGGSPPDTFLRTFVVNGHSVLSPRFAPAKRVTFQSDPPGMNITVDRTVIPTQNPTDNLPYLTPPWEFDFADGSTHVLGAPASQYDNTGRLWVLESFSIDGTPIGGEGTIFQAIGANIPVVITARFVRGTHISILTNPVGLRLTVDGRTNWPSYNFVWGVGSRHVITAPAETTDAKGRKYRFLGWAGGGEPTQELIVPEESDLGGVRLMANYEIYPRIVISGASPGVRLQVDDAVCPLPCTLDRPNGTTAALSVPELVNLGPNSRLHFDSWSDGAEAARAVTFSSDRQLVFRYRKFNRLELVSDPVGGADFVVNPASPDSFYPDDASVGVIVEPKEGYKFRRWEGDMSGRQANVVVSMTAPRILQAQLDKVPHISSTGIRNAAGETPVKAVAPGSIISIFGSGMSDAYVLGPDAPLVQTLGNVTARIGNRLLPLLFVSPEQVNAYLPSDLADGEHTVSVRNGAQPEIPGKVVIVRHAPGIFGQLIEDKFVAAVQRPDGSLASPDKPAKRGETVTFMGTGFGAYQRPVLDGFPAPQNPPNPLALQPEVVIGETVLGVEFAGAAPGMAGVSIIRFRIPEDGPSGMVELRMRQGEAETNTVLLPVE
jgi:uncharacterized protein (TIGR03437 family)